MQWQAGGGSGEEEGAVKVKYSGEVKSRTLGNVAGWKKLSEVQADATSALKA